MSERKRWIINDSTNILITVRGRNKELLKKGDMKE